MVLHVPLQKFQKAMEQVVQGLEVVGVYIDDLLVTGDTIEAHLKNLKMSLRDYRNMVLNCKKGSVVCFSLVLNSWDSALMLKEFMLIQRRWNALHNALGRKQCPNYNHSWA